ncbi:hypothetical protein F4780DRAFT_705230 [Xylariomycetidae sp. FL0641]|nr:hypothetical protein F4780DRAFT_705230 [Xylariomycetidae sp. FL0641]
MADDASNPMPGNASNPGGNNSGNHDGAVRRISPLEIFEGEQDHKIDRFIFFMTNNLALWFSDRGVDDRDMALINAQGAPFHYDDPGVEHKSYLSILSRHHPGAPQDAEMFWMAHNDERCRALIVKGGGTSIGGPQPQGHDKGPFDHMEAHVDLFTSEQKVALGFFKANPGNIRIFRGPEVWDVDPDGRQGFYPLDIMILRDCVVQADECPDPAVARLKWDVLLMRRDYYPHPWIVARIHHWTPQVNGVH